MDKLRREEEVDEMEKEVWGGALFYMIGPHIRRRYLFPPSLFRVSFPVPLTLTPPSLSAYAPPL